MAETATQRFVDFKAVKAAVTFEMLLGRYGVDWLKPERDELVGRCPVHNGEGDRAFHVSLTKQVFNCFSCRAKGNVLDFVAAMEQCSVRDAALKLARWCDLGGGRALELAAPDGRRPVQPPQKVAPHDPQPNGPLAFQLRNLDHAHKYLAGRGIEPELAEHFGVGYFAGKGSMHGRIAIPIHNGRGELVAYAGRSIDTADGERYRFPSGFSKSIELYNLRQAFRDGETRVVTVVEGFFSCMKLHAAGVPAVGLMGSSISAAQVELLAAGFDGALLLMDGDDAGRRCADECLKALGWRMWVKAIRLPEGAQPDHYGPEELVAMFSL